MARTTAGATDAPAGFLPEEIALAHSWRAFPVGPFPLSSETTAPNGVRVADRYDVRIVQKCFRHVPPRLMRKVATRYEGLWAARTPFEANRWAYDVAFILGQGRAHVATSEDEVRRCAKARADEAARMLSRAVMASAAVVREAMIDLLSRWNIPEPLDRKKKPLALSALCIRMTDEKWWRLKLNRYVVCLLENFARDIGAVHRRAGVYVSDDAAHRYAQRQRRARRYFDASELLNLDTGEVLPMSDVVAGSVSNPTNRRNELMTRMKGFEKWAEARGDVGRFYTLTTPSKFHARHHDGSENQKWDGAAVAAGHVHLCELWKRFRSWASRSGIHPYGFRVSEPHHDGTPHWHLLLFMRPGDAERVTERLRFLALSVDGDERGAAQNRFDVVAMSASEGSATGYLAKYIAKNIDGFGVGEDFEAEAPALDTATRVKAWASTHHIRQFQQIGGPGVTVWREFRRLRVSPEDSLLAAIWAACDAGEWCGYVEGMGGTEIARAHRPVTTWTVSLPGRCNRYHEPAAPRIRGVASLLSSIVTRPHEWSIRPGVGVPWTRGNNCTATDTRGHGVRAEKRRS